MTIDLPEELESSLRAGVESGRFTSVDDAVVEAVRLLLTRREPGRIGAAEGSAAGGAESAEVQKPIWEVIQEITAGVAEEEWDKLPADSSEQLDHYIYGTPRRPTA